MRILLHDNNGRNVSLCLPAGLVLNTVTAAILSAKLKKWDLNISTKQLVLLFEEAKRHRFSHAEWKLLEIKSQAGEIVDIII